jgi:glucan phosphoethanolaminetransferase (alkaline phosphatase superfamily)
MAKQKKISTRLHKNKRFSEAWLIIFVIIFGAIGSYGWLRTFAAPEDIGYLVQTNISAEEKALFSSITGASIFILAAGPVAALLFWWIWRRSTMELWAKLLLTVVPLLIVMAFT